MKQDEAPDLQQELQDLVTKTWVEAGLDVVVTSRPSGIVDASQYVDKFIIMNLLPLSSEQQRRIIEVQMEGNKLFVNLLATRLGSSDGTPRDRVCIFLHITLVPYDLQ